MTLEIQVLVWDGHKNVAGLNRLLGSQPSPLDNWISNGKTYINKYSGNLLPKPIVNEIHLEKVTFRFSVNLFLLKLSDYFKTMENALSYICISRE